MVKASIIIRTKNEERWITSCLRSVFGQDHTNFEVIIVDNKSTDRTLQKAKDFDVKIVEIDEYLPGKALNLGIRQSTGDVLVCVSAHCIPTNKQWLSTLLANLNDDDVAGVYGRQEPLSYSSDADKRDLILVFGLDRKIQRKDPFFHNANSAFRRSMWEKFPFDEDATNIEDRIWGQQVLNEGLHIVYEPDASVYHYHGIHQNGNLERCRNVVKIIESLSASQDNKELDAESLDIMAIIPIKGTVEILGGKPLVEYTIQRALESTYIDRVIVSTDNPEIAQLSEELGAEAPFIRPKELSYDYVNLNEVLQYTIEKLEETHSIPDLVVVMEATYPFRTKNVIDELILKAVSEGLDSVIPVKAEYRTVWTDSGGTIEKMGYEFSYPMPRHLKDSRMLIGLIGLGCVTHPQILRSGEILGNRQGVLEVTDNYSHLEIRTEDDIVNASKFIQDWWNGLEG